MNKYRNTKVVIDGIKFDSKKEAHRYIELKLLVKAGEIKALQLQPKFELQPLFKRDGKTIRAINYIGDFSYEHKNKLVVEDTKGFKTKDYLLKKKMFMYKFPDIDFREV